MAAQIREVAGNKLGIDFLLFVFFNLMLKLVRVQSICSLVLANSVEPPDSVISHTHTYASVYLVFLDSFAIEIIAEAQAKVPLAEHRSFLSIYDTY